jgi:hypothetical protein
MSPDTSQKFLLLSSGQVEAVETEAAVVEP